MLLLDHLNGTAEETAACKDALARVFDEEDDGILKLLLENGAPSFPRSLHRVCAFDLVESVETLLIKHADPNEPNQAAELPLQLAAVRRQESVVRLLLDHGAKINHEDANEAPLIAVLEAAVRSNLDAMELPKSCRDILVKLRLPESTMERWAEKVSKGSSTKSYAPIVYLLLDHGADPNTETRDVGNALHLACLVGDESIVCRLLDCGADANAVGGYFGTALQASRAKACTSVVYLLVARGASELDPANSEAKSSSA
ncbi:MAG: hypothetical protein Q9191_006933 [Dirinaria sp. TL-2023a]